MVRTGINVIDCTGSGDNPFSGYTKGGFATAAVLGVLLWAWWAFTVVHLWSWFVAPLGFPALSYASAIGLNVLVRMFSSPSSTERVEKITPYRATMRVAGHYGAYTAALLVGVVMRYQVQVGW